MEEEKEAKRAKEAEKLRIYREERAAQYAKEEEEAIARGDVETIYVEEFHCEICKKIFKKEGQLDNHLKSKKHKEAEAKLKREIMLDPETEALMKKQEDERKELLRKQQEEMESAKK